MATYTVDFNIPAATTGAGVPTAYPQLFLQSSGGYTSGTTNKNAFMPDSTIYIKRGDTIRVRPTNTAEADDVRQALSAVASEPDPTSPTSWPVDDETIHTYTWPTNATDLETKWYYFGKPQDGSGNYQRSGMVRINAVKIDSVTVSNSGQVAASGGTLTVAITGLAGLLSASGNNDNRLFVYVKNSSGTLITSNVSFSTATNNAYLGRFSTSTTSCTLTVNAALAQGTYTICVGHYGGDGSGSGTTNNPFYGTANKFSVTGSFTKNAPAADTTPNAFDSSLGSDITNATRSSQVFSNVATISGITAATPVSVSGDGSPAFSIAGGSYTSSSSSITNGQTIQLRWATSSSYSTAHTATLNIGGVTGSVTATTGPNPGGGTGTGGAGTGTNYGFAVVNSGNTTIFGPNLKSTHLVANANVTLANGGSTTVSVPGMTANNHNTFGVVVAAQVGSAGFAVPVTRGTNQFTLTNNSGVQYTVTYYVLRY